MDYGSLRPLKDKLEEWFDHRMLVSEDDPNFDDFILLDRKGIAKVTVVARTGCEGLADWLYEYINTILMPSYGQDVADRVWCCEVQVRETPSNMALRQGHREDREFETS